MDLRIVKTKRGIQQSFLTLFNEGDFDRLTVKQITEHAQIGRKTFYLHYLDKYDLLNFIVSEKFQELEEICEAKKELGLSEGTKIWFHYFHEHQTFFKKLFNIQNADKYKSQFKTLIVNELNKKGLPTLKTSVNHDWFIQFFAGGMIELVTIYLNDDNHQRKSIESQVASLMNLFYND
ncbi:TetR family transcriptional regulator [Staphylococcus intermedius]|uniref:TetR family transcriptional regulator n=1 Tax=Staphylococcus intermedius TaxID=1285 RepID=UPI000BBBEFB7|nr:TetR family transcriptional regulator [Staphylococcus intermedius]PCF64610.1 TetR family transcriptional regulator [Staphylococcus intermedius]PCF80220.1 TetR family transcriptional regulator [Staphylococcus intermedius]PCF81570.1 TetR family transcriptional regulator [Staphylococcus intermedius]PCF84330.1 TetR family transcriptional regulator [Staphylococcus intermedius]PCF86436.1 TetR family transcriptional regulator [Staphylococcus intermedius]